MSRLATFAAAPAPTAPALTLALALAPALPLLLSRLLLSSWCRSRWPFELVGSLPAVAKTSSHYADRQL